MEKIILKEDRDECTRREKRKEKREKREVERGKAERHPAEGGDKRD